MALDIDLLSLEKSELYDLKKQIEEALGEIETRKQAQAAERLRELAQETGYSLQELFSFCGLKAAAPSITVRKYANPDNPEQTWGGRARKPKWLQDELAKGRSLEEFLIAEQTPATGSGSALKRRSRAAAKYRNPENKRQTWVGYGKEPQWIKDALAAGKSLEDFAI